jgi:hypothetical protein
MTRNSVPAEEQYRNWSGDYYPVDSASSCESESPIDSKSSEEQYPSRNTRFSKRLAMHVKDTPSLAGVVNLLKEQWPKEYAAMPESRTFMFEEWNNSTRLRIGRLGFSSITNSLDVYASIGGGDNSTLRLTIGPSNQTLAVPFEPKLTSMNHFEKSVSTADCFLTKKRDGSGLHSTFGFLRLGKSIL